MTTASPSSKGGGETTPAAARGDVRTVKGKRFGLGTVLAVVGILLCLLLVVVVIDSYRNQLAATQKKLTIVQIPYAKMHAQLVAAGLTPDGPTLPVLLGAGSVSGEDAPPLLELQIPKFGIVAHCVNPAGDGKYLCTTTAIPIPKK